MLTEHQARRLEENDRIDVCLAELYELQQLTDNQRLHFGSEIREKETCEGIRYEIFTKRGIHIASAMRTRSYLAATVVSADCDGIDIQFDSTRKQLRVSIPEAMSSFALY